MELTKLLNTCWHTQCIPDDWWKRDIVNLSKKGNLNDCNNCQGITFISVPGKVFLIILFRLQLGAIGKMLQEEQTGFQDDHSCSEQILMLHTLLSSDMSTRLNTETRKLELHISANKIKVMFIGSHPPNTLITTGQQPIEHVQQCRYLDSIKMFKNNTIVLSMNFDIDANVKYRTGKVSAVFQHLQPIL
ncbi:hypothetical protein E2320_001822, partial [Naja naja]